MKKIKSTLFATILFFVPSVAFASVISIVSDETNTVSLPPPSSASVLYEHSGDTVMAYNAISVALVADFSSGIPETLTLPMQGNFATGVFFNLFKVGENNEWNVVATTSGRILGNLQSETMEVFNFDSVSDEFFFEKGTTYYLAGRVTGGGYIGIIPYNNWNSPTLVADINGIPGDVVDSGDEKPTVVLSPVHSSWTADLDGTLSNAK